VTPEPPRVGSQDEMPVETRQVLTGIRVVDFSWVMAGPMTTKMLAAMGAEVIKVESSVRAEYANRSSWFAITNSGKRSCTINITEPAGQELVHRLVRISDVVVENFSAGVLDKYRLGYEHLRTLRPDLIYVSASGVGRTGPQKDALAYGTLLQGYSGRAAMVGAPNPRLEAMGVLPAWTDPVTAMWETLAILGAIHHRRRTGHGAFVDLSMLESTVTLLPEALLRRLTGVVTDSPGGNREPGASPSGCFACDGDDEWLAVAVQTDAQWHGLCRAMGRLDLAADVRYADGPARLVAKAELDHELAEWTRRRAAADAEALLQKEGVPSSRSRHAADVIGDPHFVERGLFPELADGSRTIALPWMDSDGWRGTFTPAPALGADNDYVLREILGLNPGEIADLTRAGVIR
jgi:crotonobetainyl-CoA:carnitine CoA-transferase CaiB-like acyl-CoA transferase